MHLSRCAIATAAASLVEEGERGGKRFLAYNFHPGQSRAWASKKRIVAVIAGARSGKTSFGPLWLHREMRSQRPRDAIVAAPSFKLLDKAAVPETEQFFARMLRLGTLNRQPLEFRFSDEGCRRMWRCVPDRRPRILFGHADDPDSLEAMTAGAGWLDECGQNRFKLGSWEAVQRRLSIDQGRVLLTTTPYNLGWLKQLIYDKWEEEKRNHPEIDLIRFDSTLNPAFPPDEWERARRDLPRWKFDMFYRGIFTRPPGLIYDSFDSKDHVRPPFKIEDAWERFVGIDFGGVNTAATFFAAEQDRRGAPTGRLICYREYHPGKKSPAEHVKAILEGEPRIPTCVGGAGSEDDWRDRFAEAGLPILKPEVRDVEVGIDAVWSCFSRGMVKVFSTLTGLLDELASYSRVLDDSGEPTEKIDAKDTYHLLDSARYILGWLRGDAEDTGDLTQPAAARSMMSRLVEEIEPGTFAADRDEPASAGDIGMGQWGDAGIMPWR